MVKSVFVSLYVVFILVHSFFSLRGFILNDTYVDWLAAFLSGAIPLFYMAFIYIKRPVEVRTLAIIITATTGASFLIAAGYKIFENQPDTYPALFSGISFSGWALYNFWYAKFKRTPSLHSNLRNLGSLSLVDQDGNVKDPFAASQRFRLFIFHRGSWCPFCVAYVREMAKEYAELNDLDVQLNFISPERPNLEYRAAQRFEIEANFLQDVNHTFSRSLGLSQSMGLPFGLQILKFKSETTLPTVFLTDESGTILKVHQTDDYRRRPDPQFFARIIRAEM